MDVRLLIVAYLMICIIPVVPSPYRSRSRNKNSSPTYDQKQTGEYNIQLHLKDFEVVALLSESAFGELGDYDYNYDYSELTVKPPTSKPSTTLKPSNFDSTTLSPTTQEVQSTTQQQYSTNQSTQKIQSEQTTKITEKVTNFSSVTVPTTRLENELESNYTKDESMKQSTIKTDILMKPLENVSIVDKEQNQEENLPVVVHRKCANGFTRDKLGRCRRVRRPPPQFSFGISRLANLASKLRQGTNDSQTNEATSLEE